MNFSDFTIFFTLFLHDTYPMFFCDIPPILFIIILFSLSFFFRRGKKIYNKIKIVLYRKMQNKFIEKNIMVKIMVQNNGKNKG